MADRGYVDCESCGRSMNENRCTCSVCGHIRMTRGETGDLETPDHSTPDYSCPECGVSAGHMHLVSCNRGVTGGQDITPTTPPGFFDPEPTGLIGWTCPRCARGNSPFTATCPCIPLPPFVTT